MGGYVTVFLFPRPSIFPYFSVFRSSAVPLFLYFRPAALEFFPCCVCYPAVVLWHLIHINWCHSFLFPLLIGSKQHGFLGPLRGIGTYFYPGIKKAATKKQKIAEQNQEKQQYMIKVDASHTPHCAR